MIRLIFNDTKELLWIDSCYSFVENSRVPKDNNAMMRGTARDTCSLECRRMNGNNTPCTQQYAVH